MATKNCRVGMSAKPYERIEYWKKEEGHKGGMVLRSGLTYDQAKDIEAEEAKKRDCCSHPGGEYKPDRIWSVYVVWGGTCSD